jgi:hypothetical protein
VVVVVVGVLTVLWRQHQTAMGRKTLCFGSLKILFGLSLNCL